MLDQIQDFFSGTEIATNAVAVLASIVLAVWARILNTQAVQKVKASRFAPVFDAICAGAAMVYKTTLQDLKDKVKDGTLTRAELDQLSEEAYEHAINEATSERVRQTLKDMGDGEWERWLAAAIGRLKAEGGKVPHAPEPAAPQPATPPTA